MVKRTWQDAACDVAWLKIRLKGNDGWETKDGEVTKVCFNVRKFLIAEKEHYPIESAIFPDNFIWLILDESNKYTFNQFKTKFIEWLEKNKTMKNLR
ncbi:MAG: hypothetical protein QMC67_05315 [Candidatus Wallbacteria bacterium]